MPLRITLAALLLLPLLGVAAAEALGWPFLKQPIAHFLTRTLDRSVSFEPVTGFDPGVDLKPGDEAPATTRTFSVHLLGSFRLRADALQIAAPAWSKAPFTVSARRFALELRYLDLWRFLRGQRLRIENVQATSLDAHIERLADGRASWQTESSPVTPASGVTVDLTLPILNNAPITRGSLKFSDAILESEIDATWSLSDSLSGATTSGSDAVAIERATALKHRAVFLMIDATGHYKKLPLSVAIKTSADLATNTVEKPLNRVNMQVEGTLGRAKLWFKGGTRDLFELDNFDGRYVLSGPSLAAVGAPLGVTLPSTPAFRIEGILVKAGNVWQTLIENAQVGDSHLDGAFSYETGAARATLAGRLTGSQLLLEDLGPAIGGKERAKGSGKNSGKDGAKTSARVLPDRKFDLQFLRAMDANVLIDIRAVNLNTEMLEPLRPLRAHLQLKSGVLTLDNIDARTADGNLRGSMELDGRAPLALFKTDLRWNAVRLERWIRQKRAAGLPPYVSGKLNGRATLQGQGRSTAEILSTLNGRSHTELLNGSISHLAIEVGGLDIAEAAGLLFKGDTALTVQCAVADMNVEQGLFKPRVMVIDTIDSVVSVDGALSLANESLDLRLVVLPKDFSPVTLRSPLHVRGSLANPDVSVEKQALSLKLASSLLLSLLNPLAAFIPLIDAGDAGQAQDTSAGCRKLMQRRPATKLQTIQ